MGGFRLVEALPIDLWKSRGGGAKFVSGNVESEAKETRIDDSITASANSLERTQTDSDSFHLDRCLRASPQTDLTNGFFVALFGRDDEDCRTEVEVDSDLEEEEEDVIVESNKRRLKREKKKR